MDDNGGKITMSDSKGKNTITLDGSKGLILDTSGKLSINASQDIEIKGKNIAISSSMGGAIDMKASMGDMTLDGKSITAKSSMGDITLEGLNVGLSGKMSVTAEGSMGMSKMELGASGSKVSGLMAELSGSAMTTVKGGVVMIN
jgi:hypothetical protein